MSIENLKDKGKFEQRCRVTAPPLRSFVRPKPPPESTFLFCDKTTLAGAARNHHLACSADDLDEGDDPFEASTTTPLLIRASRSSILFRITKADHNFPPDPFADAEASADEADENNISSNKVPSKIHVRVQRTFASHPRSTTHFRTDLFQYVSGSRLPTATTLY